MATQDGRYPPAGADAEGGEPIPAHQATEIIGEILAELD